MRRLFTALFTLTLLAGCAYHKQPEIRGDDLDAMMERHIAFIAANSDLDPLPPPRVVFHEDLADFVQAKWGARYDTYVAKIGPTIGVAGYYDFGTDTIHLPARWKPYVDEEAVLLHELVHYLQDMQGRATCAREYETQAFEMERLWYKQNRPHSYYHMAGWEKLIPAGCD